MLCQDEETKNIISLQTWPSCKRLRKLAMTMHIYYKKTSYRKRRKMAVPHVGNCNVYHNTIITVYHNLFNNAQAYRIQCYFTI